MTATMGEAVMEFEKSLTQEEVDRFRPYMTWWHIVALQNKRLRKLLEDNNIKVENEVPV